MRRTANTNKRAERDVEKLQKLLQINQEKIDTLEKNNRTAQQKAQTTIRGQEIKIKVDIQF